MERSSHPCSTVFQPSGANGVVSARCSRRSCALISSCQGYARDSELRPASLARAVASLTVLKRSGGRKHEQHRPTEPQLSLASTGSSSSYCGALG
eukprot:4178784-Prymnesium_polylepis.1